MSSRRILVKSQPERLTLTLKHPISLLSISPNRLRPIPVHFDSCRLQSQFPAWHPSPWIRRPQLDRAQKERCQEGAVDRMLFAWLSCEPKTWLTIQFFTPHVPIVRPGYPICDCCRTSLNIHTHATSSTRLNDTPGFACNLARPAKSRKYPSARSKRRLQSDILRRPWRQRRDQARIHSQHLLDSYPNAARRAACTSPSRIQSRAATIIAVTLVTHRRTSLSYPRTRCWSHPLTANQQRWLQTITGSYTKSHRRGRGCEDVACGSGQCTRLWQTGQHASAELRRLAWTRCKDLESCPPAASQ